MTPANKQQGFRKWYDYIRGLFRRAGAVVQLAQFFGNLLQGFDLLLCQAVGGDAGLATDDEQVVTGDAEESGQADQDVVGRQVDAVFGLHIAVLTAVWYQQRRTTLTEYRCDADDAKERWNGYVAIYAGLPREERVSLPHRQA